MRVLLGLRHVELPDVVLGQDLGQRLVHLLLRKCDGNVEVRAIPRHRRDIGTRRDQLHHQLAGPIGTEVEEDCAVARHVQPRTASDHDRLDELICDSSFVATPDRLDRIVRLLADPLHDRLEGALRPLPALVAVHRVVASDDGRDAFRRQRGEVVGCGVRRDVTAVGEGANSSSARTWSM